MGLIDKVKQTAAKTADAAKGAAKAGQEKIEEQKLKKKMSDLKEELGGVVYAQKAGHANPTLDSSADVAVDRLVKEIGEQEAALAAHMSGDGEDASS